MGNTLRNSYSDYTNSDLNRFIHHTSTNKLESMISSHEIKDLPNIIRMINYFEKVPFTIIYHHALANIIYALNLNAELPEFRDLNSLVYNIKDSRTNNLIRLIRISMCIGMEFRIGRKLSTHAYFDTLLAMTYIVYKIRESDVTDGEYEHINGLI